METGMSEKLIAPCGTNCALCCSYMTYIKKLPKDEGTAYCAGCRVRNKKCAYLKGHCEKLQNKKVKYCFECSKFPCARLKILDSRYSEKYGVSLIGNLKEIKASGIDAFLKRQKEKYRCPKCGGIICVHNNKCYDCIQIDAWSRR
jgi:hypothetical protein